MPMNAQNPSRFPWFAIVEWCLVFPAAVILMAAILRSAQPPQFEPARTSAIVFEWAASHLTRVDAAMVFIGLPALVLIAGYTELARAWKRAPSLRQDAAAVVAIVHRYVAHVLVAIASLAGGLILAAALVHIATD
jgi:hypothetical protein